MTSKDKAPDGVKTQKAVEDDVEGHVAQKPAPDGVKTRNAVEDDVEGHSIGTMDLLLARELTRAKERDIQRAASRANLISEAKRALRRKG